MSHERQVIYTLISWVTRRSKNVLPVIPWIKSSSNQSSNQRCQWMLNLYVNLFLTNILKQPIAVFEKRAFWNQLEADGNCKATQTNNMLTLIIYLACSSYHFRDGPLEIAGGGGVTFTKRNSCKGNLSKKNSCNGSDMYSIKGQRKEK